MRPRAFVLALLLITVAGLLPRALWLRADPPPIGGPGGVGVVWHDEGAWVHNARNQALWNTWRTDEWNPMFVAPVFTALEYTAFRIAGVGTWQARTVSVATGLLAVLALMLGLSAVAGRRAALVGGVLLATNYVFIMWNRAALMESTMTALLVCSWAAYTQQARRSAWGVAAGTAATLAWFTKAAAAFFVAALVVDGASSLLGRTRLARRLNLPEGTRSDRRLALATLAGLVVSAAAIGLWFVIPNWSEYRFYNWQMSVLRKPEYSVAAVVGRASWIPLVQGLFAQMWVVLAAGGVGALAVMARWRSATAGERLLVLWLVIGFAELVVHDSGNERRYVMFIPALVALAAIALASGRPLFERALAVASSRYRLAAIPVLLWFGYVTIGTAARAVFLPDVLAGSLSVSVRLSTLLSVCLTALVVWQWRRLAGLVAGRAVPAWALTLALVVSVGWNTAAYARWAARRSHHNSDASFALGTLLPEGALVQGKLANGLALDNGIRPLFVGNGFGNYADRLRRDDARYILTYDLPRIGYESSDGSGLIQGILDQYPLRRVVATFDVDETPGADRAVLIDKFPSASSPHAPD